MRTLFLFIALSCSSILFAQQKEKQKLEYDKNKPVYTVEAACGSCQFHMEGKGCELAIKYEGNYYYVTGTDIDDHGDAHEKDGFCNAIRNARVQGEVVGDKFHVTWFQLTKGK